ncbi:hypothetical protein BDA96_03G009700 [Sorghum bicolor]|uniref:Uncharacterized protein n=2 Tax=Sorghum bicolor TaxID=4558 RepID=A0A921R9P3_SORBI|nr:hypothetical protein BDA96_03G009700 [Sorghum bicolor]OQU86070.1 hypothetical protein SORBI_3003G008850 [Sorghum bicolor]
MCLLLVLTSHNSQVIQTPAGSRALGIGTATMEPLSGFLLQVSGVHSILRAVRESQFADPLRRASIVCLLASSILQPVVFLHLHGGTGDGPGVRRFFDPDFYRIVLLDQVVPE